MSNSWWRPFPTVLLIAALAGAAGCATSVTPVSSGTAVAKVTTSPAGTAASAGAPGLSSATIRGATLSAIAMSSLSRGHALYLGKSGGRCVTLAADTTDGGARFSRPAPVASWPCAGPTPADALAFAGANGFAYGPGLFATHDGGRTWAADPQPGPVLAVAPIGRSVWMAEASCAPGAGTCRLRLLESADGGRSWAPAPAQPSGARVPAGSARLEVGATAGQNWLVRTGVSTGYLVAPPDENLRGRPDSVPLWFTSDAGRTWSRRLAPCQMDAMSAAVSATPAGTVLAVCAGQPGAGNQGKSIARSTDGGGAWTLSAPCPAADPLCPRGVTLDSGYLGGVVVVSGAVAYLYGARSSLLITRDGGADWKAVHPLIGDDSGWSGLARFFGAADGVALAVGGDTNEGPAIWRTADGGIRWSHVTPVLG